MKVTRIDTGVFAGETTYEIEEDIDIRTAAMRYGHTDDIVEIADDNGNLIARAIWPQGYKIYRYSEGRDFDPYMPELCIYRD